MHIRSLALAITLLAAASAEAAEYPERRIRVVAPFAAGASADIAVRLITNKMGELLKQQFIVENRTGALGALGTAEFAKAEPDGYTILYGNNGQITDVTAAYDAMGKSPPYDPATFVPIGRAQEAYFTLAVNAQLPIRSLQELTAHAKAHPGKLTLANGQPTAALSGGLLKGAQGLDIVVVPYRGDPQAMSDVVAGHVQLTVSAQPLIAAQLAAGKIRLIGSVGSQHNPFYPELRTLAEQGAPDFARLESWGGFFGPPGFPKQAADVLSGALKRALQDQQVIDGMRRAGIGIRFSTPEELSRLVANRSAVAELIRRHRIDILGETK